MNTLLFSDPEKNCGVYTVPASWLIDLRHKILRPGLSRDTAILSGDGHHTTWHIALVHPTLQLEKSSILCCASFMRTPDPLHENTAYQLRGMATDDAYQGKGFGALLLQTAERAIAAKSGVNLFWCNARVKAIPFYKKCGWSVASERFDIPPFGQHRIMLKKL